MGRAGRRSGRECSGTAGSVSGLGGGVLLSLLGEPVWGAAPVSGTPSLIQYLSEALSSLHRIFLGVVAGRWEWIDWNS